MKSLNDESFLDTAQNMKDKNGEHGNVHNNDMNECRLSFQSPNDSP